MTTEAKMIKLHSIKQATTFGFSSMALDDTERSLIVKAQKKTQLRKLYFPKSGNPYFYHNNICYSIRFNLGDLKDHDFEETSSVGETEVTVPVVEAPVEEVQEDKVEGPVVHSKHEMIKTCIGTDIPVYLVGEAGTGKNYTLQSIAEELEMDFYFTNSVQQEYKITGFIDAGGVYHETEFYKAFTNGGLFFLDEMDASIPEVLVLLNAAIANRYFEFPCGRVDAHENFRVVAAGNTLGTGANETYNGRLVLDGATLDRFVTIEFDYDRRIELSLSSNNVELVNFIGQIRGFCKDNGIRATFSYRCIMNITKLETAGLDLNTILDIAVFKGMDLDTVKTIKLNSSQGKSGKYYSAFLKFAGVSSADNNFNQYKKSSWR